MNELEKDRSEMTDPKMESEKNTELAPDMSTSANGKENEVEITAEVSSPAEKAASQDVCAEEESPALDLAEAADEIMEEENGSDPEEEADATEKTEINFHVLSKEELRDILKSIVENNELERHKDVTAIKQAYYSIHNKELNEKIEAFVAEGNSPEAYVDTPDPIENEIKELMTEFREKRNAYLAEKEEDKKKNLEEKKRIINELIALADDIDNINLHFQKFQQLQQDFKAIGEVPASSDNEIWKNYQTGVELFYDRLKLNKELRDLDFKKNLELKQSLIEKAKELADVEDVITAFKRLQDLHLQWREIGPVARDLRESVWNDFKEATTIINKKHQDFFQNRKANEQANEEAKTALCEKAEKIDLESLKNFNDWDNATKEIMELQQEWKNLGFASRKVNNQLFARFRKTCDDFFAAKAEYFKKTKEESKKNLALKEALCEKAEAMLEKAGENNAHNEVQALREEWKKIGVVRRKQGDEVWQRFCKAIDAFYDARKKLFSSKRDEEKENLEIKRNIIEELKAIPDDAEKREVSDIIKDLRKKWQQTGFVPFKYKDDLNRQFKEELDRLYKAFGVQEASERLRRYERDVKRFEGDDNKINREREKLQRAIESREAELKTIENNLGFFNFKSKSGNTMMKDFEKKIDKIKEEIEQIREKIKLLDSKPSAEVPDSKDEAPENPDVESSKNEKTENED